MTQRRPTPPDGDIQLYPADARAEILPFVPHGTGTVLDVGCGRGGFGRSLRASGRALQIWAIEPNEAFRNEASIHYDGMLTGQFPAALSEGQLRFDCIVFNDVLEHLEDPWTALQTARVHLEPGGFIVASIPNIRNARTVFDLCVRGNWTYVDMGVLDRTHLRFFTRRSIGALFHDTGFEIDSICGINAIGRSYTFVRQLLPSLARDFAYTGFGIRAHPSSTDPRY